MTVDIDKKILTANEHQLELFNPEYDEVVVETTIFDFMDMEP